MGSVSHFKAATSEQANQYLHSSSSEKAAWIFGAILFTLLFVFIVLVPNPSPSQMGLIRYMTALSAAFLSFFFVGKLTIDGHFMGFAISSTSGIAVFVGMLYFSDRIFKFSPEVVETTPATRQETAEPAQQDDQPSTPIVARMEGSGSGAVIEPTLVNLSQIACNQEAGMRSTTSNDRTTVTFENLSRQPVSVYWLDYEGKRKLYLSLAPDRQSLIDTWSTHLWLVTDAQDACSGIYRPQSRPGRVIFR